MSMKGKDMISSRGKKIISENHNWEESQTHGSLT